MSVSVQSFLLCKSVVIQKSSRTADLHGVFDVISAPNFPRTFENCVLYIRLLVFDEASCSVSVEMEAPSLAGRQIMKPWIGKPDPNGKIKVRCEIARLQLPEEGIYTLQLLVNGATYSEYHVSAIKRRVRTGRSPGDRAPEPSSPE